MNLLVKALLFLLVAVPASRSEDLQKFSRLYRDNVALDAKPIAGGSSTRDDFKTNYGSYDKTKTQARTIEISVRPVSSKKEEISIRFYFVFRDAQTKEEVFVPADTVVFKEGSGTAVFSQEATSTDLKLVTIGIREKTGESIYGWLARAVRGDRIVGVAGSVERFEKMAGDPEAFKK